MKGNIQDWRKVNLSALREQREVVGAQYMKLEQQLSDLNVAIKALEDIKLRTRASKLTVATAKSLKHWTQNPPRDPVQRKLWEKKVAKWKVRMKKIQKMAVKAKAAKKRGYTSTVGRED